jgi:hypothetical protein
MSEGLVLPGHHNSPHISPIREDMAQDIGFTVHCPRAAHTHCICKRGQCAVWIQGTSQIE